MPAGNLPKHESSCKGGFRSQQMAHEDNEDVDMKEHEQENKMAQSVPALVTNNNFNVLLNMAMNETTSTFKS